jgi:hypothetical protein
MEQIIVNKSHAVFGKTNEYLVHLFSPTKFDNKKICLSNLSMYFSWRNLIANTYANTDFEYKWIDGTVIAFTISDGYYSVADLSTRVQAEMVSRGHYLTDGVKNYYYISLSENSVAYGIDIICQVIPAVLPVGWTYGTGTSPAWVCALLVPQFRVKTAGVATLLGQVLGYYPPDLLQTSDKSYTSSYTPMMDQVSSVIVLCSVVHNNLSGDGKTIYSFSMGLSSAYGTSISVMPNFAHWVKCNGTYTDIVIQFFDQMYRPLPMIDTDITLNLLLTDDVIVK